MRADTPVESGAVTGVPPSAMAFLEAARLELETGKRDTSATQKYASAYLAALRAAAALVAARLEPGTAKRRKNPQNLWQALPGVEPAFTGWARRFAAEAERRAAVEATLPYAVSLREAEKLLNDATAFVSQAERTLGVTIQPQPAL